MTQGKKNTEVLVVNGKIDNCREKGTSGGVPLEASFKELEAPYLI